MDKPRRAAVALGLAALLVAAGLVFLRSRRPAAQAGQNAFIGNFGTMVLLPGGYTSVAGFSDDAKTLEVAYFFPAGTPPEALQRESEYDKLGIVRLEVAARAASKVKGAPIGLSDLRASVPKHLEKKGETVSTQDFPAALPAFMMSISAPSPLTQVFLEGKDSLYIFTAGRDTPLLREMVGSLRELPLGPGTQ